MERIATQKEGGSTWQNLSYDYDRNGNITTITDEVNNVTQTFTYDRLNRLTSADGHGTYPLEQYKYDSLGNIKQKGLNTYNYDYSLRPHAPYSVDTPGGTKNYGYDVNGNMTNRDGKAIVFNSQNMPTSVQGDTVMISLAYDPLGARVKKVSGSKTIIYFGAGYEIEREGTSETIRKHIFAGGDRIVTIENSSRYFYYHGDQLGSTSLVTIGDSGSFGDWFQKAGYYSFGEKISSLTYKNPAYISDPFSARHLFTGQEEDSEAGLYNYNARLYDPFLGKFISPDPIVPSPGNPQSLNRYAYVLNNPLRYIDPSGHGFFKKLFKSIFGTFIPLVFGIIVGMLVPPAWGIVAAGVLGGMAGGLVGAAMTGGNLLEGALLGGVFGGIGAGVFKPLATAFGGDLIGKIGAGMTIAAGATVIATGIYGGKLIENIALGAITAGVYAAAFSSMSNNEQMEEGGPKQIEEKAFQAMEVNKSERTLIEALQERWSDYGLDVKPASGEEWRFDPYDHGGPHFTSPSGRRYDLRSLEPIPHKGVTPPSLSKSALKTLMASKAWQQGMKWILKGAKFGGVGIGIVLELATPSEAY